MDETQNDAPFVAFYDMHAVTFVPPDEMADVTIAGLQWFILSIPLLLLSVVSTVVMWENSHRLGKNIERGTG